MGSRGMIPTGGRTLGATDGRTSTGTSSYSRGPPNKDGGRGTDKTLYRGIASSST